MIRKRIRFFINRGKINKRFESFVEFFIVLSVISFTTATIPNLYSSISRAIELIEVFCAFLFTFEYCLRLYTAPKKLKYIFSFLGIIDFFALISFFPYYGAEFLKEVRVLRIFRLLRIIKNNRALNRFRIGFKLIKDELIVFFFITFILAVFSSSGIYYFENQAQPEKFNSLFSSLWWSVVTLTTVGYGDVYPITNGGRIFTLMILIISVGIITVPAGLVSSALSKARQIEEENKKAKQDQ